MLSLSIACIILTASPHRISSTFIFHHLQFHPAHPASLVFSRSLNFFFIAIKRNLRSTKASFILVEIMCPRLPEGAVITGDHKGPYLLRDLHFEYPIHGSRSGKRLHMPYPSTFQ